MPLSYPHAPFYALVAMALSLAAFSVSAKTPAQPDIITGVPIIVDGDTIKIEGQRIRLSGIDAPEQVQVCTAADKDIPCGKDATYALAGLIGSQAVTCKSSGRDPYRRMLATCAVGGQDIGAWMVENGHAMAYRHYSTTYVAHEERAKAAHRGIWATEFTAPWDWRREKKGGR